MVMKLEDYRRKIKTALGVNTNLIDFEIPDEELDNIINDSLDEMSPYISTTKYMTLPYSKIIDLSDKNVYNVFQVFRGTPNGTAAQDMVDDAAMLFGGYSQILMTGSSTINGHSVDMFDQINLQLMSKQYINSMRALNDIDFSFKDNKLYIDATGAMTKVTIEYSPKVESVEDIDDQFWERKLKDLAIANTKVILGRLRTKYVLDGNSYSLDGQILLDEGNSEKNALMEKLENSAYEVLQILD